MVDNLQEIVHQALDNAKANGYDMTGWNPDVVAEDLVQYDAGLEGIHDSLLIVHVITWQHINS